MAKIKDLLVTIADKPIFSKISLISIGVNLYLIIWSKKNKN